MKKAWLVLFALVLAVCLTSCGDPAEVGSYELDSMTEKGETMSLQDLKDMYTAYGMDMPEFGLTLNKDGTGKMIVMGETQEIKWDAKSKTMSHDSASITYIFEDNMIRITDQGTTLVFKKK